mgnify:CR=1 FL=1|jgi:transcriptional regulator with XRE-family HTH domain
MDLISKNIRKLRMEKGITQIQLSKMIGSTNDYISKLERGLRKNPSSQMLGKIANALGVSMDRLYKEDDKELSLEETLREICNNAPETDWPVSALIVKKLIEMDLINEDGTMSPQVQKLVTESITLQSKLQNITKKKNE